MRVPFMWVVCLALTVVASRGADSPEQALAGTMASIGGESVDLGVYTGKVVLVVNVASRCGFTPQYKGLQDLSTRYATQGLVVLGFPCNQFGKQEPGSGTEIKAFCQNRFGVTFPLFAKIEVNGEAAAPLYRYLTSDKLPVEDKGPVKWNFEKFLIGRNGKVIARYRSRIEPDDPQLIRAVEAALGTGRAPVDRKVREPRGE